jgi:hypothetical protein
VKNNPESKANMFNLGRGGPVKVQHNIAMKPLPDAEALIAKMLPPKEPPMEQVQQKARPRKNSEA